MADQESKQKLVTRPRGPTTEIIYQKRSLNVYNLTEHEVDELAETGSACATNLGFASFCLAGFLAFLVTLLTVDFTDEPTKLAAFLAVDVVAGILAVYFGIMWIRGIRKVSRTRKRVKGES